MVKLGKIFSIILVFALLVVLAPALVPRAASAVGPLPNPLTVSFDADIDYTGAAWSFNVTPDPVTDSMGMQYTRTPVVYNTSLTDCEFYNISAASGTLGGDLNGSIELEWNRLDLNMTYPYTPLYVTSPDGMGILYIKGNLSTTELGDFKFIGAGDFDYKGAEAKGEGRMCTVIPWAAPPVNGSLEEVLVGEITDYTLNATKISGNLSLRYYNKTKGEIDNNWSKMYLLGVLGGDTPDNITTVPETMTMVQFTQPNLVPTDSTKTVAMEESHPGRETPQRLISGYIGTNGTITLRRTGVYVYQHFGLPNPEGMDLPAQSVHLIKNTLDNWVCNDTQYRGLSESLVGVDMVDFTPEGVDQQSYSWQAGYSPGYEGEGYFKGYEAYSVSSTHITLTSDVFGTYYDFRLKPTPVISSVNPGTAPVGETLDVTINGKWLLIDPVYHQLTIDLGTSISTNSYTVVNDTQVIANITVAGAAAEGFRNVSVTKLGVTGTLTDGFEVTAPTGRILDGNVDLQGFPATAITVRLFLCNTTTEAAKVYGTTDSEGNFTIGTGLPINTTWDMDIAVKGETSLSSLVTGVNLSVPGRTAFGILDEGDALSSNDDYIDGSDFGPLSSAWLSYPGITPPPAWDPDVDFSRDNYIDGSDFGPLSANWLDWGACYGWPGDWS